MIENDTKWLECTPIEKFYSNSVIFVTGGTGFIGSTLIEKLLRACPGIKRIYLLIRDKKQKASDQRMQELFDGPFWDKLKMCNPKYEQYVSLINGDMINEDLGISAEDYEVLTREVNVIFHAAATVRFDEKLNIATQLNVQATKNVLHLAEKCANLKSFVHVSTAYSQCYSSELEEIFYPAARDPDEFLAFCSEHTLEDLDTLTPSIIGKYPNTYTFTKHLAEQVVKKYDKVLPIAITRPSIVMSILHEPVPGWIPNLFGPIGLMVGISMGLVRVLYLDKTKVTDIVPGDLCVNHLISVAHETSKSDHKETGIKIYNYGSGKDNPVTWDEFFYWSEKFGHAYACVSMIMYLGFYFLVTTPNMFLMKVCRYVLHIIPAHLVDTYLRLTGRPPKLLNLYRKVHKMSKVIHYFTVREWIFHNDNTKELYKNMDPKDQRIFGFDMKTVEWDVYFYYIAKAFRFYMLKEPVSSLRKVERKMFRFKLINNSVIFCIIFLVLQWIFNKV